MKKALISAVMITYGHQDYIEQAILSILMQEGDFELELVICNDKSPDQTDDVVKKILDTHHRASCIRYYENETNLGIMPNLVKAMQLAKGEYIAICEGDDYWTNKLKLQKQLDFLEDNAAFTMICHNALKVYEGIKKDPELFTAINKSYELPMDTIVHKWVIPTASMFFRRKYIDSLPNWVTDIYSGDYTLALLLGHFGKIWFDSEVMSVYRISYTGTSASATVAKNYEFVANQHIKLLGYFDIETNHRYSNLIETKIVKINKDRRFVKLRSKNIFYATIFMPGYVFKKCIIKIFGE